MEVGTDSSEHFQDLVRILNNHLEGSHLVKSFKRHATPCYGGHEAETSTWNAIILTDCS